MSQDISGFGLTVRIIADTTFPMGFTVSQFADDGDPFDIAKHKIADTAMGLNGDMVSWSAANPIPVTITVVPGSQDDRNLTILFESNRVGRGKQSNRDQITMVAIYPDGSLSTYTGGRITDGMSGKPIASNGRQKSKVFDFVFENYSGAI